MAVLRATKAQNITDDRFFPFSPSIRRSIGLNTISELDASHLDSPAETIRRIYFPTCPTPMGDYGSLSECVSQDAHLPRHYEHPEPWKTITASDSNFVFGWCDVVPNGMFQDRMGLSSLSVQRPCLEELPFDRFRTHSVGFHNDQQLMNFDENTAREFLSRFSTQKIIWIGCPQILRPLNHRELCCAATLKEHYNVSPVSTGPTERKMRRNLHNQRSVCRRNMGVHTLVSNLDLSLTTATFPSKKPPTEPNFDIHSDSTTTQTDAAQPGTSQMDTTPAARSADTLDSNNQSDDSDDDDGDFMIHKYLYRPLPDEQRSYIHRTLRSGGHRSNYTDLTNSKIGELEIGFLQPDSGLQSSLEREQRKHLFLAPHRFLSESRRFKKLEERLIRHDNIAGPAIPTPSQLFLMAQFDQAMIERGVWPAQNPPPQPSQPNADSLPICHPGMHITCISMCNISKIRYFFFVPRIL